MQQRAGRGDPYPVRSDGFDGLVDKSQGLLKVIFPDIAAIDDAKGKVGPGLAEPGGKDIIELDRKSVV